MADSDILRGARLAAAARELGMSENELFEYIGKKTQSANRRSGINRSQEQGVEQFLSKFDASQQAVAGIPREISGKRSISNDIIESGEFGNQDELQNFGGIDDQGRTRDVTAALAERELLKGKADSNIAIQKIKRRNGKGYDREEIYIPDGTPTPDALRESLMARDFGLFAERNAPSSVALDAADRVQQSIDLGRSESGAEDVVTRLQDSVYGNPAAEQALVRDMIRADAGNVNLDAVRDTELINAIDAERISRTKGGRIERANQVLADMGIIGKLGRAKYGTDFSVSAPVPGRETDPTSLPINTPELLNAPQTDNRYAGPLQRGEQWLADTTPGYREGSGVFGDYPQVAIDSELGGVEKAIRDVRMRNQGIENPGAVRIRGIDDLQSALDQVIGLASDTNTPLFRVEDGKRVTAQNPGIPEALTKLGLNRNSQDNLARALFQVEAGKRGGTNAARKEMFSEGVPLEVGRTVESGGTHESLGGGAPEIARLGKETVNVGTEVDPQRRQVSAQLQALTGVVGNPGEPLTDSELRDARSPFQGGTAEGGVPRAEFIKGRVRGMSPEQREAEFGPVNAEIANRVERRYLDSEAKRQKPQGMSETGAKFAARDAEAAVQSAARQRADADRAIMEIRGNAPRGQAQSQLATSAAVNQNTQSAPLEVRDGWMSGGGGPRITDSIRNQLSELNSAGSPQQGPRMSSTPRDRSMGERVAYATNKIKGYATSPRYQRGRRAGYFAGGAAAGIAGLDALIGGEQEKRQQEAMY